MKQLTCDMCGGTDIVKENGVFTCKSCGCKYSIEDTKRMMSDDTPIAVTVKEPVKVVNNDFEAKLAEAETWEHLYFERGKNAVVVGNIRGFEAVVYYYSRAEVVGANEYKYWEKYAEFYQKGILYAIRHKEKRVFAANKDEFVQRLSTLMDFAVKYTDSENKDRLIQKKKAMIEEFESDIDRIISVDDEDWKKTCGIAAKCMPFVFGALALLFICLGLSDASTMGLMIVMAFITFGIGMVMSFIYKRKSES